MYEIFQKLMEERGLTAYRVSKETGVSQSTLSAWKLGQATPKTDKLFAISEYFGVSLEYLMTGEDSPKESTTGKEYRFSDRAAQMAQILTERPDLMDLLAAAENLAPEAVRAFTMTFEALTPKAESKIG